MQNTLKALEKEKDRLIDLAFLLLGSIESDSLERGCMSRILRISKGRIDPETNEINAEWVESTDEMHLLAAGMACAVYAFENEDPSDNEETIALLCRGNLALGALLSRVAEPNNEASAAQIISSHASKNGKSGAKKKNENRQKIIEWAIDRYKKGNWRSASDAAYKLADAVIEHGRSNGFVLTEQNAQRTIAEWFRKSV